MKHGRNRNAAVSCALLTVTVACAAARHAASGSLAGAVVLQDTFDEGLVHWIDESRGNASIVDVGGEHGRVLKLRSDGDVHLLVRGSERWGDVRIEGTVQFPESGDAYLGVIYNHRESGTRSDFGLIYIKFGRSVYLQPNPHRDYNVTRTFYPEFEAPLAGGAAIRKGEWQRFRVEVVRGEAHFYVGEDSVPELTFPIPEPGPGRLGLQPRSVGNDVLVDDIRVERIQGFSWKGAPVPALPAVARDSLRWEVAGPFARTRDDLARAPDEFAREWRPFARDLRGGIATAEVLDYHGTRSVAYFRTQVSSDRAGEARLRLSSVDDLAIWVNGRFATFAQRQPLAWYDHGRGAGHEGASYPIDLHQGTNTIVIRARGGLYAAGGFFAHVEAEGRILSPPQPPPR